MTHQMRQPQHGLAQPSGTPATKTVVGNNPTVKVDGRQLTIEGFRSLGLVATFFAGLQAQMLSASLSDNSTTASKIVNAFWLAGIFLDVFGAVLATLTARWFEVLDSQHIHILDTSWFPDPQLAGPPYRYLRMSVDWFIANALFSGVPIVAAGVTLFLVGLVVYVWDKQPLVVSIIATIPFAILAPFVAACFYPHSDRKGNVIRILGTKRGAW